MKKSCAVCNKTQEESKMTLFAPTPTEKEALKKMGEENPLASYAYCKACVGILSNPVTAIPLMKGLLQFRARSIGVSVTQAEAIAERFGKKVLELTYKPRS